MSVSAPETEVVSTTKYMQLGVLIGCYGLMALVMTVMVPALPGAAAALATGPHAVLMAQVLLVGPFAAQIFGAPATGLIVGVLGRRWPLLAALMLLFTSGIAGFWVESFWPLLALRLLGGLATAAIATIAATLAGDYFSGKMQERAIASLGMMPALGSIVALAIGGYLVKIGNWHTPFLLFLIVVPIFVAALFFIVEPEVTERQKIANDGNRVLPPAIPIMLFWVFIGGIAAMLTSIQLPFLLSEFGVDDPSIASTILATGAITATAGAACYPRLRHSMTQASMVSLIFLTIGSAYFALGLVSAIPAIWIMVLASGAGIGLIIPFFTGRAMDIASAEARPRAMGLVFGAMLAGQFAAPFVTEPLRSAAGTSGMFVIAGAGIACLGILLRLFPALISGGGEKNAERSAQTS